MASYNNIILLGNIGSVQVKTFQNGGKIVEATMATSKRWKDRNGEQREETQWHNIIIGGNLADTAEKYVQKGDPLFVTGEMTYRKYQDKEGNNRSVPEVRVLSLQLLPKGMKEGTASNSATGRPAAPAGPAADPALVNAGLVDPQEGDGDLPF